MEHPTSSQALDEKQAWPLHHWLSYLESIHSKDIDMGLERVRIVFEQLGLDFSDKTVVTVAGTNGKGTTCVVLEQTAMQLNKSVGVYSSPHILDYRERVRINGSMLDEREHCRAFLAIEQARQDTPLTYFEFGTLAGLYLIANSKIELALLEVGLGGRLDAVNVVDPDIAVITGIALDHQDWLGDTREAIATEKAGIFRPAIKAVVGDPMPPTTLTEAVDKAQLDVIFQDRDFIYSQGANNLWEWKCGDTFYSNLPMPHIPIQNASTAFAVIKQLNWPVSASLLGQVLKASHLPGRHQIISQAPLTIVDVAHNPQAIVHLVERIASYHYDQLYLVVAMLSDKDIEKSLEPFENLSAKWFVASLDVPRGANSSRLKQVLGDNQEVTECDSVSTGLNQARQLATSGDLVVVFGSFYTVAAVLQGEK